MSANFKIRCPGRPICPTIGNSGQTGQAGRLFWNFSVTKIITIKTYADFAEGISRGIGNRELLVESMLLFYGKAIVETENWLSQSMHYFSKESIAYLFRKTEGAVHNRDIAGRKLS